MDNSLARGWGAGGGRTGAILDDAGTWAASGSFAESGEVAAERGGETRDEGAGGVGGGSGDDGGEFGRGMLRAAAEASLRCRGGADDVAVAGEAPVGLVLSATVAVLSVDAAPVASVGPPEKKPNDDSSGDRAGLDSGDGKASLDLFSASFRARTRSKSDERALSRGLSPTCI